MSLLEGLLEQYGYIALILVLWLDSFGVPWPTEATLVLTGAAAHAGHINLYLSGIAALSGAVTGSTLSYLVGQRFGPRVIHRVMAQVGLPPQWLDRVDTWFARHGHRAVFFARMVPFVRCFAGFPAGAVGMPFGRYLAYSMAGYSLYIALALLLGYAGLSLAMWLAELELVLYILIPLGGLGAYYRWGRKWLKSLRGKGL